MTMFVPDFTFCGFQDLRKAGFLKNSGLGPHMGPLSPVAGVAVNSPLQLLHQPCPGTALISKEGNSTSILGAPAALRVGWGLRAELSSHLRCV